MATRKKTTEDGAEATTEESAEALALPPTPAQMVTIRNTERCPFSFELQPLDGGQMRTVVLGSALDAGNPRANPHQVRVERAALDRARRGSAYLDNLFNTGAIVIA